MRRKIYQIVGKKDGEVEIIDSTEDSLEARSYLSQYREQFDGSGWVLKIEEKFVSSSVSVSLQRRPIMKKSSINSLLLRKEKLEARIIAQANENFKKSRIDMIVSRLMTKVDVMILGCLKKHGHLTPLKLKSLDLANPDVYECVRERLVNNGFNVSELETVPASQYEEDGVVKYRDPIYILHFYR